MHTYKHLLASTLNPLEVFLLTLPCSICGMHRNDNVKKALHGGYIATCGRHMHAGLYEVHVYPKASLRNLVIASVEVSN